MREHLGNKFTALSVIASVGINSLAQEYILEPRYYANSSFCRYSGLAFFAKLSQPSLYIFGICVLQCPHIVGLQGWSSVLWISSFNLKSLNIPLDGNSSWNECNVFKEHTPCCISGLLSLTEFSWVACQLCLLIMYRNIAKYVIKNLSPDNLKGNRFILRHIVL